MGNDLYLIRVSYKDKEDTNNLCTRSTSSHPPIIIVDDDKDIKDTISLYLSRKGKFTIQAFSDAIMAFEHLYCHAPEYEILISDIRMPGMSGFQLVR